MRVQSSRAGSFRVHVKLAPELPLVNAGWRGWASATHDGASSSSSEPVLLRMFAGRDAGQSFFKDLCRQLHGANLSPGSAGLFGQAGKKPLGGLAHRYFGVVHPVGISRPTGAPALARHEPAAQGLDDGGETGSTKRAAADIRQASDDFGAEAAGNPANVLCHGYLPPFLVLGLGRGGLLEREADLELVAVDDETDRSLAGLASHAVQEVT